MVNIQIVIKGFNNGDSGTTTTWSSAPCLEGKVGDGFCDDFNNKADCEFDQGKIFCFLLFEELLYGFSEKAIAVDLICKRGPAINVFVMKIHPLRVPVS